MVRSGTHTGSAGKGYRKLRPINGVAITVATGWIVGYRDSWTDQYRQVASIRQLPDCALF
jgi:hypothetical protein